MKKFLLALFLGAFSLATVGCSGDKKKDEKPKDAKPADDTKKADEKK